MHPTIRDILIDDADRLIDTLPAWERQRAVLIERWNKIIKPLSALSDAPRFEITDTQQIGGVIRQLIRYENAPGQWLDAYLLKPLNRAEKCPGIVAFHSSTDQTIRQPAGLAGLPHLSFGFRLAQRGCVAICPMNFLWTDPPDASGQYDIQARTDRLLHEIAPSTGMAKMLFDARRAVDLLRSLAEVDGERIGSVGHSLGGKQSLYLAAFDPRVKVAVASECGIGLRMSNWSAPWYLHHAIDEPGFDLDHHHLLAMIAPRPFLLVGGNDADGHKSQPIIDAARGIYRLFGQPDHLRLSVHDDGHEHMPQAISDQIDHWLMTHLSHDAHESIING